MTPPREASYITQTLFGDKDAEIPTSGTSIRSYFEGMSREDAWAEWRQLKQLPEGERLRDMLERTGEDRA